MEEVAVTGKLCEVCAKDISVDARFCRYCGAVQTDEEDARHEQETKK